MRKRECKGSFTIEIACIFPIILFVILGLIYCGFYLHDRVTIAENLNRLLSRGRILVSHEADLVTGKIDYDEYLSRGLSQLMDYNSLKEIDLNNYIEKQLDNGLFVTTIHDIEVIIYKTKLEVKVKGTIYIPLLSIRKFFNWTNFAMEYYHYYDIHDPMNFIRISDQVLRLGSRIEGVDKGLIGLKSLLERLGK